MDWLEANGVGLRYDLAGSGAKTLALVHEMGGSLDSWDMVLPALAADRRVLRYDTRGAGQSEKERGPGPGHDGRRSRRLARCARHRPADRARWLRRRRGDRDPLRRAVARAYRRADRAPGIARAMGSTASGGRSRTQALVDMIGG
jgi:pimeloyl-ACP methyl ester carboxylesterase